MSFRVTLGEDAARAYANLAAPLRRHFSSELRRLRENPSTLSRPAHFPHPQQGQLFDADTLLFEGHEHFLTLMFTYSNDETTILIEWIVHRSKPVPSGG